MAENKIKDETKQQIHNILYQYCKDFLQAQEITHAANEIIKDPTEDTILKMTTYLDSFDTVRYGSGAGQFYLMPTCLNKGLTANNVRFAMSDIRKLINEDKKENNKEDQSQGGN